MPALRKDRGRPLPYSTVLSIKTDLRQPGADKTQIAASRGVERKVVGLIDKGQTPAQKRVGRCRGCGGKQLNKSKPCRVCPLRQSTAA